MSFVHLLVLLGVLFGEPTASMLVWENPLVAWSLLDYGAFCPLLFSLLVVVAGICNGPMVVETVDGLGGVARRVLAPARMLYRGVCFLCTVARMMERRELPQALCIIPVGLILPTMKLLEPIVVYSLGLFGVLIGGLGENPVLCHYRSGTFLDYAHYNTWGSSVQGFWCDGERHGLDLLSWMDEIKEAHLDNWEMVQLIILAGIVLAATLYTFVHWLATTDSLPGIVRFWFDELAEAFVSSATDPSDGDLVGASVNITGPAGEHGADNTVDTITAMLTPLVGINRELEASTLVYQEAVARLEGEALSRGQELDAIRSTNKELQGAMAYAEQTFGQMYPQLQRLEEENAAIRQAKHDRWRKANPCGVLSKPRFKRAGRFTRRFVTEIAGSLDDQLVRAPRTTAVTVGASHQQDPTIMAFAATGAEGGEQALALSSLEDRLHESLAEVGRLEDECSERKLAVSNLEAQLSEKALEVAALEAKKSEQELADTELRKKSSREVEASRILIKDLEAKVAAGASEKEAHAAQAEEIEEDLRARVESMQILADEKSQKMKQIDRELSDMRSANGKLRVECEFRSADLARAKEQIETLSTRAAEVAEHDEASMEGVVVDDPEKTQLRQQVADSETRAQALGSELGRAKSLLAQKDGELQKRRAHHASLEEGQVTRDYQIQDLQSQCQQLRNEASELRKSLGFAKANAASPQALNDANLSVISLKDEVSDLKRQLAGTNQPREASQQVVSQLRTKLQDAERAYTQDKIVSSAKITKLEGELKSLRISQSNASASKKGPFNTSGRVPISQVLDSVKKQRDACNAELKALKEVHGSCEKDQAALQERLCAAETELAAFRSARMLTGRVKRTRDEEEGEEVQESAGKRQKDSTGEAEEESK